MDGRQAKTAEHPGWPPMSSIRTVEYFTRSIGSSAWVAKSVYMGSTSGETKQHRS